MNDTGKGNLLEVTKSGNLVVRPYFPLILCFFDWFFFKFWNARFRGNYTARNPMFGFVVGPEVLCKETSCDLSNLVKVYMGKYPINPLRGICSWLICHVLGCVPSVFVVEMIVAILIVLIVPVGAPVVFRFLSFRDIKLRGVVMASEMIVLLR
jgi:hypothetical protein